VIDAERKIEPNSEPIKSREIKYEFLCNLPIMLRCKYCLLHAKKDRELTQKGECVFDQGGYFVINGSEKVNAKG